MLDNLYSIAKIREMLALTPSVWDSQSNKVLDVGQIF